jgi:hypothetical protein
MKDIIKQKNAEKKQQEKLKNIKNGQSLFIEVDFLDGEPLIFPSDVYSLTIAANMTKSIPPAHFNYCLK